MADLAAASISCCCWPDEIYDKILYDGPSSTIAMASGGAGRG